MKTEEKNIFEDYKKALGEKPEKQDKKSSPLGVIVWALLVLSALFFLFVVKDNIKALFEKKKLSGRVLSVYFLDIGQGDSILLKTPAGKKYLIDGGNVSLAEGALPEEAQLYKLLKKYDALPLDGVLATHQHADHIGGLSECFELLGAGVYYDTAPKTSFVLYQNLLKKALEQKTEYSVVKKMDILEWDPELKVQVIGPLRDYGLSQSPGNNNSIVLRVIYGETIFLFMGDIEKEAENDLAEYRMGLKCDVLKVPHHGSASSSTTPFLKYAAPAYAVIQCGKNNVFGHPHEETVNRIEAAGSAIFRNDIHGTVIIETDGKNITVNREF